MSRLSGLSKLTDKKERRESGLDGITSVSSLALEPLSQTANANATTTYQGSAPPSSSPSPSLSSLATAAVAGAKPRQSLASLAGASPGGNSGLSSLRAATAEGRGGRSFQDLAKGTGGLGSGAGSGLMAQPAGSLTRLTASSDTAPGDSRNGSGEGTFTRLSSLSLSSSAKASEQHLPSSSLPAAAPSFSPSSSPSLSQLAAASQSATQPQRRSLASLATSSVNRSPSSSTTTTAAGPSTKTNTGLTLRSGGLGGGSGGLAGSRLERPLPPKSNEVSSSSLSGLATASLQPQKAPSSLADLAKAPKLADNDKDQSSTAASTSIPTSPTDVSYTQLSATVDPMADALKNDEEFAPLPTSYDTSKQEEQPLFFSSLIAAPSYFALSIFEDLKSAPSPIALSTTTSLKTSDPEALLRRTFPSSTKTSKWNAVLEGTGAGTGNSVATLARVFRFDTPSPDDVIFKAQAQGYRPAAIAGRI